MGTKTSDRQTKSKTPSLWLSLSVEEKRSANPKLHADQLSLPFNLHTLPTDRFDNALMIPILFKSDEIKIQRINVLISYFKLNITQLVTDQTTLPECSFSLIAGVL